MNERSRLRRPEPTRTSPLRNWSTLYRQPHAGVSQESPEPSPPSDQTEQDISRNDTVSQGVNLGYRVIEDYLRQGQRVAQQINTRSYNPEAVGNDIQEMVERLAKYYIDLGALWGDLVNSLLANPEVMNNLLRPFQPTPPPPKTPGVSANGTTAVTIEVISPHPLQVTLDLHPYAEHLPLATHGLRAVDSEKPPLTDITFEPSANHGPVHLRIRIPEVQPPDTYSGLIVDKTTNLPKGSLMVKIST